jgi:hypothetical protein
MNLKVGRVVFSAEAGECCERGDETLFRIDPFREHWQEHRLYDWDCRVQKGLPEPPPQRLSIRFQQFFHVTDAEDQIDAAASAAMAERFRWRMGCKDFAEMGAQFEAALPAVEVAVPGQALYLDGRLTDRFSAGFRVDWVYMVLRLRGLPPGDHVILGIPRMVMFLRSGAQLCLPGADPEATYLRGDPVEVAHRDTARRLLARRLDDIELWTRAQKSERGG